MILNELFILSRNRMLYFLKYEVWDMTCNRYCKPNIFIKVSYVIFFYNCNNFNEKKNIYNVYIMKIIYILYKSCIVWGKIWAF